MANLRNRQDYLDSYTPGEASELLRGSRYQSFTALPGALGDLSGTPKTSYMGLLFDKISEFESKVPDRGGNFQRFLSIYNNPDSLANAKMKVPTGLNQALGLMSSFGS